MRHPHVPLAIALCAILSLMTDTAHAQPHVKQTTTTYTAGIEGIVSGLSVLLTVTRVVQHDGAARTDLQYVLRDAEPGSTNPTRLVAQFNGTIPEGSYLLDHTGGAHLIYLSPDGPVDLRWDPVPKKEPNTFHNTFSATTLLETPTSTRKETQDIDTVSARPVGILAGRIADGRRATLSISIGTLEVK